jgi:hypothetical protein
MQAASVDAIEVVARPGIPPRISALLPIPSVQARCGNLQLMDDKGAPIGGAAVAVARGEGMHSRLRARLDPRLSPGHYWAELRFDTESHRLRIEVPPVVALRPERPVLLFQGAPGETVRIETLLANQGNTAAELPAAGAVGIFKRGGIDTAIGKAYRSESEDGLQILAAFVLGLREQYGGLLKLHVEQSAGQLKPGSIVSVGISASLPSKLAPGQVYTGIWSLANLNYPVRVEVTTPAGTDHTHSMSMSDEPE